MQINPLNTSASYDRTTEKDRLLSAISVEMARRSLTVTDLRAIDPSITTQAHLLRHADRGAAGLERLERLAAGLGIGTDRFGVYFKVAA